MGKATQKKKTMLAVDMENRPIKTAARASLIENTLRTAKSIAGQDDNYFKVFTVGFNKTGTTSMYTLFRDLGFEAMDGPHWRRNDCWHLHYQFQTFTDGPPEDFRYLDRMFPRSKFILNVRRLDEWLDSRIEHVRARLQEPNYKAAMSRGKLPTIEVVRGWATLRQTHHQDVLTYFAERPQDLLVVNFIDDDDAAARIAGFVGRSSAEISKPFVRSTVKTREHGQLRNADMIAKALTGLGLTEDQFGAEVLFRANA